MPRRAWGGRDNTWCVTGQLGVGHPLDLCKTALAHQLPQEGGWAGCQVTFNALMRNREVTIYTLSICLPTENWVSVVTSHKQNADEPTHQLTQTASAPCHVGSSVLITTWGNRGTLIPHSWDKAGSRIQEDSAHPTNHLGCLVRTLPRVPLRTKVFSQFFVGIFETFYRLLLSSFLTHPFLPTLFLLFDIKMFASFLFMSFY